MSVTYISHIETAKKHASLETLVKIAAVFGVTVDQLLNGNQENDPAEYRTELAQLVDAALVMKKGLFMKFAFAAKTSIRNNKCLQDKDY